MSPADFELAQEEIEDAYCENQIDSMELRRRMYALGFSPAACDDLLDELDFYKSASVAAR